MAYNKRYRVSHTFENGSRFIVCVLWYKFTLNSFL